MPVRTEVRRLGMALFEEIADRVRQLSMPSGGMSAAEFEGCVLKDVAPTHIRGIIDALAARQVIYVRRNRGEIKVFAKRPAKMAGLFDGREPVDRFLSTAVPHVRRIVIDLDRREAAKAAKDTVASNEARDRLDVSAQRLVDIVRAHEGRGLCLSTVRRELWSLFPADVMDVPAIFEPSLRMDGTASPPLATTPRVRIEPGLLPHEKVGALLRKAGEMGMSRSGLTQSIRPKLTAADLSIILESLLIEGSIDACQLRVKGPKRTVTKYFWKAEENDLT